MPNELEFCEATHVYKMDGRIVPGVTSIIRSIWPYKRPPGWTDTDQQWYMDRGTAVHHGCHLWNAGKLRWDTCSPVIASRIRAWEKFRTDLPTYKLIASEQALGHATHQYAGKFDCLLEDSKGHCLADIKSDFEETARLQCGAYSLLIQHNLRITCKSAVIVVVGDDARYKTHWITAAELRLHERQFLSALTIFGFAQQYGLKGNQ